MEDRRRSISVVWPPDPKTARVLTGLVRLLIFKYAFLVLLDLVCLRTEKVLIDRRRMSGSRARAAYVIVVVMSCDSILMYS